MAVHVRVRVRVQVVDAHRNPVRAEAQDVRVQGADEEVAEAGGYADVLVCRIRGMPRRREVWEFREHERGEKNGLTVETHVLGSAGNGSVQK